MEAWVNAITIYIDNVGMTEVVTVSGLIRELRELAPVEVWLTVYYLVRSICVRIVILTLIATLYSVSNFMHLKFWLQTRNVIE